MEKDGPEPLFLLGIFRSEWHTKIKAEADPYDPMWKDYLINRLNLNSLPGNSRSLINA